MKAQVKYEFVGTTSFGDPEIVVTVLEPHPKAGRQFLLRSTASMDHMSKKLAETGKTTYLIYEYPDDRRHSGWHGAVERSTLDRALEDIAGYVDWLHRRERVREDFDTMDLKEHLERFDRALYENGALDYEKEWEEILLQVARITLALKGVPDADA